MGVNEIFITKSKRDKTKEFTNKKVKSAKGRKRHNKKEILTTNTEVEKTKSTIRYGYHKNISLTK